MAGWSGRRGRARLALRRALRSCVRVWGRRPALRRGSALALAFAINGAIVLCLAWAPFREPPPNGERAPIELIFLAPEPAAVPESAVPEPESEAEPEPEPAPPAPSQPGRAVPTADLPSARGQSGVVGLDCNAVFDEEGRAIACAGGAVTLDYDLDRDAWRALGERLPGYGPELAPDEPRFGEAGDGSLRVDPDRLRDFRRQTAPGGPRFSETVEENVGAQSVIGDEAEYLDPPSIVTSFEERKRLGDAIERRRDAEFRRDMERENAGR